MIEKLNVRKTYHAYAYKSNQGMYYVSTSSSRCLCSLCKYDLSCPYSYMELFQVSYDNVIKCMRFVPFEGNEIRNVGLYFNESSRNFNRCLLKGKIYD